MRNISHHPESLILSGNDLNGTIPTELGLLTSIEDILLNINKLTGLVPSELGMLTTLGMFIVPMIIVCSYPTVGSQASHTI